MTDAAQSAAPRLAEETEGRQSAPAGRRPKPGAVRPQRLEDLEAEVFELVCRHMRTLTGAHEPEYEDLVQMAAERALRDLPAFEGRSSLSTWLFRLCYSVLLTHRRWYRRWLKRFKISEQGELPEMGGAPPKHLTVEWHEKNQRVRAAIERLSEKKRVVVTLHDLQGVPIEQIAELLDLNQLTVRSRLRDGRRDLKQRLSKDPYFGDEACTNRVARADRGSR